MVSTVSRSEVGEVSDVWVCQGVGLEENVNMSAVSVGQGIKGIRADNISKRDFGTRY